MTATCRTNLLQSLIRFDKLAQVKSESYRFADYLNVGEAAAFLGVSASTLRNWDKSGKLTARRHPVNGYRCYKKSELKTLLANLEMGRRDK